MPRPTRIGAASSSARWPELLPSTDQDVGRRPRRFGGALALRPRAARLGGAGGLGHPGAEHVGPDHRDRGQDEDPEDRQVGDPDQEEVSSDIAPRTVAQAVVDVLTHRTVIVVLPTRPGCRRGRRPATLWPSMRMPLVEPRSLDLDPQVALARPW